MAKKEVTEETKNPGTVKAQTAKTEPATEDTSAATAKGPDKNKKTEGKKAPAAKTEPVKTSTTEKKEKTTTKKTTARQTTAKKTPAKKEMKVNAVVEYQGNQTEEKAIIANVKKAWTKSGKKVGDIKTVDLYIKPEEYTVYYVINGTEKGSVGLY